jgi:outer membrane protein OmpA-like peptidoglycan-associated protein
MSVKTYLLGKGVNSTKIKTASQGTKNKSSDDNTDKEKQLKKGVEIIFNYRGN